MILMIIIFIIKVLMIILIKWYNDKITYSDTYNNVYVKTIYLYIILIILINYFL